MERRKRAVKRAVKSAGKEKQRGRQGVGKRKKRV